MGTVPPSTSTNGRFRVFACEVETLKNAIANPNDYHPAGTAHARILKDGKMLLSTSDMPEDTESPGIVGSSLKVTISWGSLVNLDIVWGPMIVSPVLITKPASVFTYSGRRYNISASSSTNFSLIHSVYEIIERYLLDAMRVVFTDSTGKSHTRELNFRSLNSEPVTSDSYLLPFYQAHVEFGKSDLETNRTIEIYGNLTQLEIPSPPASYQCIAYRPNQG